MDQRAVILMAALMGTAAAQDVTGLPSLDPSKLGGDVFALGGVVLLIVQFFKRQVERRYPDVRPWVWWAVSILLAEAGAAGLYYAKFGATLGDLAPPWGWLLFGLLAGLSASGFKDLAMGFLKTPRLNAATPDVQVKVENTLPPAPPAAAPVDPRMTVIIERPGGVPGLDDTPMVR